MKLPFKTQGMYVRKVDSDKELPEIKETKLGNMLKIATGVKIHEFYETIWFKKNYIVSDDNTGKIQYCADVSIHPGELLELASWSRQRGFSYAKYQNVVIDGNEFKFGDSEMLYSGSLDEENDILSFTRINNQTKEKKHFYMRYVAWS